MISISRFVPLLCAAVVLHLLPATVSAEGDPPKTAEVLSVPDAGYQGPPSTEICTFSISVPKSPATFETSAALLFLQPSCGNLVYATVVNPFPFLTPHWRDQAVDPELSPAFNVGIRYVADGGGDMTLDWTHLNSNSGATATAPNTYVINTLTGAPSVQSLGPSFLIGPPLPFGSANAVAHFDYDAVNWETGLTVCLGTHVQLRPFVGLQGARVSQGLATHFQSNDGSINFTDDSRSVFTGAGPRLGMDVHYVSGNLDFVGGIAGATLIGGRQSRIDLLTASPLVTSMTGLTTNAQFLTSPASTQVIPCIEAKLGASYALPAGRVGIFKCEAGYQAAVYINAINQFTLGEVENSATDMTEGLAAVFLRTAVETQTNFFVHGPYVKLALEF